MRIAAAVRGLGWALAALALVFGAFGVFQVEGEEALFIVNMVAVTLALLIGVTQGVAWFIEKHAERVVVR